ncbi:hypothetical protein RCH09_003565 [Actimicrobium sp. GrIS 1.19]|uniref:glycosyltransferase n=1 Tax=Actimicrobium sp. GrIS 1.19 TaxID=3071708 RepID=UPI002E0AA03A|nr:hypothetical protein [Actimicrobium sp. GrIS 1.19]
MKLLYLPNEGAEGDQIGPRRAFERFHAEGRLSAYKAYSYLVRAQTLGNHRAALEELLSTARGFAPDVIFVQHMTDSYPVDRIFLQQLKNLPSRPRLVLWEGDAYGTFFKPLDATLKTVMAASDMVFLVGLGYLADAARKAGATNIRFSPHSFDSERFGLPWEPSRFRPLDIVMIANLHRIKRIPGLYLPGGRQRQQLAKVLFESLGERFAVYGAGKGWDGKPYMRGPIPFHLQSEMTRSAWMSISWDHFYTLPLYTSDRLMISLANGVPFLTNRQPGYELVFGGIPGLYCFDTAKEAVDIARYLLSMPVDRRIEIGMAASKHMIRHFHADQIYGDVMQVVSDEFFNSDQEISRATSGD